MCRYAYVGNGERFYLFHKDGPKSTASRDVDVTFIAKQGQKEVIS